MREEDLAKLREVKAEFGEVTKIIESDFKLGNKELCEKRINFYAIIYNIAVRLNTDGKGEDLAEQEAVYEDLYLTYQQLLTGYVTDFAPRVETLPDLEAFTQITVFWQRFRVALKWLTLSFGYLSRYYVQNYNKPSLMNVAYMIFYNQLFERHTVAMRSILMSHIQHERDGEVVNREAIKAGIDIFSAVTDGTTRNIFTVDYLEPFLEATTAYYTREIHLWLARCQPVELLHKIEASLAEECTRCSRYFSDSAKQHILRRVEELLLDCRGTREMLLESPKGFNAALEQRDEAAVRLYYTLFSRVNKGVDGLATVIRTRVAAEGVAISQQYSGSDRDINCQGCVMDLVKLQEEYVRYLQNCLGSNAMLMRAFKDGLEKVFNLGVQATDGAGGNVGVSFSELLANFCDIILRNPEKSNGRTDVFDSVVSILGYVSDRDTFQSHARELLSKRLLSSKANESMERDLIWKLKKWCGSHFTTQFESMLSDKTVSAETTQKFNEHAAAKAPNVPTWDRSFCILRTGVWPKFPADDGVKLPGDVAALLKAFEQFYSQTQSSRFLKWSHTNSTATITARLEQGIREFQLTAFQALVLLLFNSASTLTAQQMLNDVGCDLDELKRILPSFVKVRLLTRTGELPTFQLTDSFVVNPSFSSAHRKMQIPLLNARITVENTVKARAKLEDDRKLVIDACIVRVRKSRRTMLHTDLLSECVKLLQPNFVPEARLLKQRIEDLIKREYLERAENNANLYKYLA